MRKNYTQTGIIGEDDRIYLENDWYGRGLPPNVRLGENVFVDTSYGFAGFHSERPDALFIDRASGCYDRSSLFVGEEGKISVGKFCILNGTTLVCNKNITIGDHCMMAWGSVITDSWLDATSVSVEARRILLKKAAADPLRRYPFTAGARPVVLEDNCWVGFDAVILPGSRLGKGCVIGCKTVIDFDVPRYAVVAGSPAKIVRYLTANDTDEVRLPALQQYLR